MRLFFAVFPPLEVQQTALKLEDALRQSGESVSWIKLDNLHFTLRFLGELGESGLRRAAEAGEEAVAGRTAFDATLGPLGAFPNARRARVLWVAMSEGAEALSEIARALEQALVRRGFERADKPFSPHLTLGRVRIPNQDWTDPLTRVQPPADAVTRFRVDRLLLMESKLSPKGSTCRESSCSAPMASTWFTPSRRARSVGSSWTGSRAMTTTRSARRA